MDDSQKQDNEKIPSSETVTELTPDICAVSKPEPANSDQVQPGQGSGGYGVEAPTARVYPSGFSTPEETPKSNAEEVSLETIYMRRKEKEMGSERTGKTELAEPVPLPPHPFFTHLLRPLINPGMFIKLGCLACLLWGLLLITVPLFQRNARKGFRTGGESGVSVLADMKRGDRINREEVTADTLTEKLSGAEKMILGRKGGIISGAWRSYAYIFLFAFVPWIFCAIPFLLQTTEQTSNCDDKISEWPELSPIPMICRFGWFLLLVLTAGLPGYLIFGLIGLRHFGFLLTFFILFPVFYLSTADTDSFFCLLSQNILRGMKLVPKAWRNWYFLSFFLAVTTLLIFFLTVGDGIFHIRKLPHAVTIIAVCSVMITFAVFLYFRLLGRLAWTLRDRLRINAEKNAKEN